MVRRSPRGCLRRLYADEEGRATMTRDDVSGAPQRAPSGKQTHPRGGARGRSGSCFGAHHLTLLLLLLAFSGASPFRDAARSCTTHSYINMSSSREEIEPIRARRTRPASPSLLPSHPLSSSGSDCSLRSSRRVETCRRHRARRRTRYVRVLFPSSPPPPRADPSLEARPSPASWAFSFARAGYREQFVTGIRAVL